MAIAGLSLRVLVAGLLGKVTGHLSHKFFPMFVMFDLFRNFK